MRKPCPNAAIQDAFPRHFETPGGGTFETARRIYPGLNLTRKTWEALPR
jgi:hypothetical protein